MLLVAAAGAAPGESQATRTDRFHVTLPPGSTLRVENVSGDVVATPGPAFSAVVTVTVAAPSQSRADEILGATRIVQSREGDELALETHWPEGVGRHDHRSRSSRTSEPMPSVHCRECKITARYEVVVPPGVRARLRTVNGEVRVNGLDGDVDLQTVNGGVTVRGARRSVTADSVNGKVDVAAQTLPASASVDLKTVNGSVLLTLPKDTKFDLSASTMNGKIASTFPLPPRDDMEAEVRSSHKAPPPRNPPARMPRPVVVEGEGEEVIVDLQELEKEIEESMKDAEAQARESMRGMDREMRRFRLFTPGNEYGGSVGGGGARVKVSTLNGSITVLATGSAESEAKALVSPRRFLEVQVPRVEVRPRVAIPKALARVAPRLAGDEDDVIRGDVSGDLLATTGGGNYRVGKVSGRVKILTRAGEIHVASAGSGADLKTYGGDIAIGAVNGDLKAQTLAGDVRAGAVAGSANVDTSGGDVRIDRVGGSVDVRTAGGDIVLPAVGGGVLAKTGGGDVRVVLISRQPRGGVFIHNSGGDVTLTLPGDIRADVELDATGCDDATETYVRSDFPEVAVIRRSGSSHGSGAINGGGPRLVVRTNSGTIRLRKGATAGN
jgi:DUF4097 and DUF4098 domain-containing protein YvlB